MTKAELESKHLSELHALAAEADLPRCRMLRREELIEKLAGGEPPAQKPQPRRERKPRERRERRDRPPQREPRAKEASPKRESRQEPAPAKREERTPPPAAGSERPRRRRRRRFGRKPKDLRLHDLLTPGAPGRQTIVYAETREGCTTLLRGIAAGLAGAWNGAHRV